MRLDPSHVSVYPTLQKFLAAGAHVAIGVEQLVLGLHKGFWLAHGWGAQVGQHIAQGLLRHRCADDTDRYADHARRLACPGILPTRTRSRVNGIFQHASYGAVVFRRDKGTPWAPLMAA